MNKITDSLQKTNESYQKKADAISTDYGNTNLTPKRARQLAENQRKANGFLMVMEIARKLITLHETNNLPIELSNISTGTDIEYILTENYPNPIGDDWADWAKEKHAKQMKICKKLNIHSEKEFSNVYRLIKELANNAPKTGNSFSESAILLKYPGIRSIPGFFPTPKILVDRMIEMAEPEQHYKWWEPQAGFGSIADAISEATDDTAKVNITVCEKNPMLASILMDKGYSVVANDMYDMVGDNNSRLFGVFDRVLMNPPFERNQDIEYVQWCYKWLKQNGRLISIMAVGWTFNNNAACTAFREWIGWTENDKFEFRQSGEIEIRTPEKRVLVKMNSEGSFKSSFNKTGISTLTILIDRYELANSTKV